MNLRLAILPLLLLPALAGCSSDDGPTATSSSTTPYFQRLTNSPAVESSPRISPDGKAIAYEREGGIRMLDIATRAVRVIVPQGLKPSWTSDGSALVFVRRDVAPAGLIHRLMKITLASGALDTLSADSIDAYEPAVSPVDDRIVLRVLSRTSLTQSLRILDPAGVELRTVTKPGTWVDMTPAWSANGGSIVFVRLDASGTQRLAYVSLSGGGAVTLANAAGDRVADPMIDGSNRLYFSKDGTISWSHVVDAPRALIDGPGYALSPTLSDDRTHLVFTTDRTGNRELWMLVDPQGINPIATYSF